MHSAESGMRNEQDTKLVQTHFLLFGQSLFRYHLAGACHFFDTANPADSRCIIDMAYATATVTTVSTADMVTTAELSRLGLGMTFKTTTMTEEEATTRGKRFFVSTEPVTTETMLRDGRRGGTSSSAGAASSSLTTSFLRCNDNDLALTILDECRKDDAVWRSASGLLKLRHLWIERKLDCWSEMWTSKEALKELKEVVMAAFVRDLVAFSERERMVEFARQTLCREKMEYTAVRDGDAFDVVWARDIRMDREIYFSRAMGVDLRRLLERTGSPRDLVHRTVLEVFDLIFDLPVTDAWSRILNHQFLYHFVLENKLRGFHVNNRISYLSVKAGQIDLSYGMMLN